VRGVDDEQYLVLLGQVTLSAGRPAEFVGDSRGGVVVELVASCLYFARDDEPEHILPAFTSALAYKQ
jgi:hypothetical protein